MPPQNHVGNGQSHTEPAEPPRDKSPVLGRQADSQPSSSARRDSVDRPARRQRVEKWDTRSNETQDEQQKQSASTTPERGANPSSAATTTSQIPAGDGQRPQNHHNFNAATGSRQIIGPRWVKPSETKLEAAKAAAARNTPTAPSSPNDGIHAQRRARSKGFVPGSDRGSNASQYDNVPGLPEQDFEILELEKPPSRMRTPFSSASPARGPSPAVSTGPRTAKHLQFPHSGPPEGPTGYTGGRYNSPPRQHSPGRTTTEVPILHPGYSVSLEDTFYGAARFNSPYREPPYATTHRRPNNFSPEKTVVNNSFATYRRQPPPASNRPKDLQQLTSTTHIQTPLDYRFEVNPPFQPGTRPQPIVDVPQWDPEGERPPQSPGGMQRSPSFQQAQMSPVHQFTFTSDPDVLPDYRTPFQEQQPVVRQQLPQLFGGPHYRHAPEAFAMQESMLL